jgi:hypothetical protein
VESIIPQTVSQKRQTFLSNRQPTSDFFAIALTSWDKLMPMLVAALPQLLIF